MLDDLSAEQLQAISRNLGSISRNLESISDSAGPSLGQPLSPSLPPLSSQAQAGGETLRACVTDLLGIAKNTKRSSTRLKETLQRHGLVAPLFLLIAQQRSATVLFPPALATPMSLTLALVRPSPAARSSSQTRHISPHLPTSPHISRPPGLPH